MRIHSKIFPAVLALAGLAAPALADSVAVVTGSDGVVGGSTAGKGSTSTSLGTGGSTAGERERSGSSTGTTLGTGGSSARMPQDMDNRDMRGRGHRRHHGNRDRD
jgi:hypothetical protein